MTIIAEAGLWMPPVIIEHAARLERPLLSRTQLGLQEGPDAGARRATRATPKARRVWLFAFGGSRWP